MGAVHKVLVLATSVHTLLRGGLLALVLLNDSRRRRCMDLFQTHIQLSGHELGLLVPEHPKTITRPSCISRFGQLLLVVLAVQFLRYFVVLG